MYDDDRPLGPTTEKRRAVTEAYYEKKKEPMKKPKAPDEKKPRVELKPDAAVHKGKNVFNAKKDCCPGQMYVPKREHNESTFAGELKQKSMY